MDLFVTVKYFVSGVPVVACKITGDPDTLMGAMVGNVISIEAVICVVLSP